MKKMLLIGMLSFSMLSGSNVYADSATATQSVRIIIPKVALIDTDNSQVPLQIDFDPIVDAGDNFATAEAVARYDVTSNIRRLKLYAKTDKDLQGDYKLDLKVKETNRDGFKSLSTTSSKVSNQNRQVQTNQALTYRVEPVSANQMPPYGNIDVKVIYTLVEP